MALLNYSTKIEAQQTIAEIQQLLSVYGVQSMLTEYEGRNVSAVSFKMDVGGNSMGFRMPCNWRGVREIFKKGDAKMRTPKINNDEQAIRTAWRIILVWVKAQLALVEVNMVTIPQVFLPYVIMKDNRTLAETVTENPQFLLGNGN